MRTKSILIRHVVLRIILYYFTKTSLQMTSHFPTGHQVQLSPRLYLNFHVILHISLYDSRSPHSTRFILLSACHEYSPATPFRYLTVQSSSNTSPVSAYPISKFYSSACSPHTSQTHTAQQRIQSRTSHVVLKLPHTYDDPRSMLSMMDISLARRRRIRCRTMRLPMEQHLSD